MPRYVILEHVGHGPRHWDLMLETGPALSTWALDRPPEPDVAIEAEALPDHRLAYLDYEGPISRGRGSVTRWDSGQFQIETQTDDELTATLTGTCLLGQVTLVRKEATRWQVVFAIQTE